MIVENGNFTGMKITPSLLCFFIFTAVFYVILDLYKKRRLLRFSRDLELFPFYPIVGNVHNLVGENFFIILQKFLKVYSPPRTLWIGHECFYVTADADEIKAALNHPKAYEKSWIYETFKLVIGESLLVEKYEQWKINRKIFQKGFSQQFLKSFVDVFYAKSCNLVNDISEHQPENKIELFNRFSLGSFIVNSTGFSNENGELEFTKILDRFTAMASKRMIESKIFPDFLWKYTQEGRAFYKDKESLRCFVTNLIQKKKQELSANKELPEDSNSNNPYLLDLMLENEYKFYTEEDIYNQFSLFIIAATDTTGLTLAYMFTLLGMNPNAQEKIYEEVKDTVGLEKPICYSDLANLKYTERALFESMRLLPVLALVGREAAADIDLGTRIVPAGASIIPSIFHLHRSEKYWKDPLKYDPDRFLPEEVAKRHPYAFLPFGGGPRNCIGMKYGIMALKIAIANVIRNYKIVSNYKSVEELKLESAFTMHIAHDIDCEFTSRKYGSVCKN